MLVDDLHQLPQVLYAAVHERVVLGCQQTKRLDGFCDSLAALVLLLLLVLMMGLMLCGVVEILIMEVAADRRQVWWFATFGEEEQGAENGEGGIKCY